MISHILRYRKLLWDLVAMGRKPQGQNKVLAAKLGLYPEHIEGKLYKVQGFDMYLTTMEHIQRVLIEQGAYEWAETSLLPKFVKRGSIAVNVGANVGYYSLLLSRLVGHRGHIYAFEPLPINFERLKINIDINVDNVTPYNLALGDAPKISRYKFNPSINGGIPNFGGFSMVGTESEDGNIVIETITLDDFVQQRAIQDIRFLKIDVEGFESQVLNGARATVQRFRPTIMVEYLAMLKTGTDQNVREIQRFMDSMGYTVCRVHKKPRLHIEPVVSEDFEMPIQFNAICY